MLPSSRDERYETGELQHLQGALTSHAATSFSSPWIQPVSGPQQHTGVATGAGAAWAGFGSTPSGRLSPELVGHGKTNAASMTVDTAPVSSRTLQPPLSTSGIHQHGTPQHSSSRSNVAPGLNLQQVNTLEILGLTSPRASPPPDPLRSAEVSLARGLAVSRIMESKPAGSRSYNSMGSMQHDSSGHVSFRGPHLHEGHASHSSSARHLELQPWQIRSTELLSSDASHQLAQTRSSKLRSAPVAAYKADRSHHSDNCESMLTVTPLTNIMAAPATVALSNTQPPPGNDSSCAPMSAVPEFAPHQLLAPAATVGASQVAAITASGTEAAQQQKQLQQVAPHAGSIGTAIPAAVAPAVYLRQSSGTSLQQASPQPPPSCLAPVDNATASCKQVTAAQPGLQPQQVVVPGSQSKKASKPKGIFACCFGGKSVSDDGEATTAASAEKGASGAAAIDNIRQTQDVTASVAATAEKPAISSNTVQVDVATEYALSSQTHDVPPALSAGAGMLQQNAGPTEHRSSEVWGVTKPEQQHVDMGLKVGTTSTGEADGGFTIKAHHFESLPEDQTVTQAYNFGTTAPVNFRVQALESGFTSSTDDAASAQHSSFGGLTESSAGGTPLMFGVAAGGISGLSRRVSSGRRFSRQGSRARQAADAVVDAPSSVSTQYPVLFTATPPAVAGSLQPQITKIINSNQSGSEYSSNVSTAAVAAAVAGWLQSSGYIQPDVTVSPAVADAKPGTSSALQSASTAATLTAKAADASSLQQNSSPPAKVKRAAPRVTMWTSLQQQLEVRQSQQQQMVEKQRAAERKLVEQQALLKQQLEALRKLRSRSPSPLRTGGANTTTSTTATYGTNSISNCSATRGRSATTSSPPRSAATKGNKRAVTPPRRLGAGSVTTTSVPSTAVTVGDLMVSPNNSRKQLMSSPEGPAQGNSSSNSNTAFSGQTASPVHAVEEQFMSVEAFEEQQAEVPSQQQLRTAAESLLKSLQDGTPMAADALASLLNAVNDPSAAAAAAALATSTAAAQEVAAVHQQELHGSTAVAAIAAANAPTKKPFVLVLPGQTSTAAAAVDTAVASRGSSSCANAHHISSTFKVPKGLLSLSFKKKGTKVLSRQVPKTYRAFCRHPALSPKGGAVVKYSSFKVSASLLNPESPGSPKLLLISPSTRFNSRRILSSFSGCQAMMSPAASGKQSSGDWDRGWNLVAGCRAASVSSAVQSLRSQKSFAVSGEYTAEAADEETAGTAATNLAVLGSDAASAVSTVQSSFAVAAPQSSAHTHGASPGSKQQKLLHGVRPHQGTALTSLSKAVPSPAMYTTARRATADVASVAAGRQPGGRAGIAEATAARRLTATDSAAKVSHHMMSRESYLQFLKQQVNQCSQTSTSTQARSSVQLLAQPGQSSHAPSVQMHEQHHAWQQPQQQQMLGVLSTPDSATATAEHDRCDASQYSPGALSAKAAAQEVVTGIAAQAIQSILSRVSGAMVARNPCYQESDPSSIGGCSLVSDTDTPSALTARAAAEAAVAAVSAAADARTASVKAEAEAALLAALAPANVQAASPADVDNVQHCYARAPVQPQKLQVQPQQQQLNSARLQLSELRWEKAIQEEQQRLQEQHIRQQMLQKHQEQLQEQRIQELEQQLALLQMQQQQQSGQELAQALKSPLWSQATYAPERQPMAVAVESPVQQAQSPNTMQDSVEQQQQQTLQSWQAPASPSQVSLSPKLQMQGLSPRPQQQQAYSPSSAKAGSPSKVGSFNARATTPPASPGHSTGSFKYASAGARGSASFKYSGRSAVQGSSSFKH